MVLFVSNKAISLYNSVIYLTKARCFLKVEFQRSFEDNNIEYVANVYEYACVLQDCDEIKHLVYSPHRCVVGTFSVEVFQDNQSIRLGPQGQLGMLTEEYQGQSIGRYCISKLLILATADVSPFKVLHGRLTFEDAKTPKAKSNRNTFYRKLGLTLKLDSDEHKGVFFCNDSSQLTLGWNRGKLREIDSSRLLKLFGRIYKLNDQINRLESAYKCKDESLIDSWKESTKLKKWLFTVCLIALFLLSALLDTL